MTEVDADDDKYEGLVYVCYSRLTKSEGVTTKTQATGQKQDQ
jgi:hypothetical protein